MPTVTFLPYGIQVEVSRGASLLAAADEAAQRVPDDFFCGELCEGRHECGNCCVGIERGRKNLSPTTDTERALLTLLGHADGIRTACTARIEGDVTVRLLAPVRHDSRPPDAHMQAHP